MLEPHHLTRPYMASSGIPTISYELPTYVEAAAAANYPLRTARLRDPAEVKPHAACPLIAE